MPKCDCCGREFAEDELVKHNINYGDDLGVMMEKLCYECHDAYQNADRYEL